MTAASATYPNDLLDNALTHFDGVKRHNPNQASGRCPAHDDKRSSLSIGYNPTSGKVLLDCKAGCHFDDITQAAGLGPEDLNPPRERKQTRTIVCDYVYEDEDGKPLFFKRRFYPKNFLQGHWDASGAVVWGLDGVRRVLFHLPQLKAAEARGVQHAYLVEGEKDVLELEKHGVVATTWTDGAAKWRSDYAPTLAGWYVTIVADRDGAGLSAAQEISADLARYASKVRVVQAKEGKDAYDHLQAGYGVEEFVPVLMLVESAPVEPVAPDAPVTLGGVEQAAQTGAELLEDVRDWLATYIHTVTETDLDLLTLWVVHTHLVNETYTTPRLQLDSPVPGSGKTTCLEHIQRLSHRPVQMASLTSAAMLTRMLDAEQRTILIDEADRSLNQDKDGVAELLAVLNSGYKRGGTRPVLVPGKNGQWDVKEMPTYAPVAMAGNNPNLPEDTKSRIIRVLLLPDLDGSVEESDWELIEEDAIALRERIAKWADSVRDSLKASRPDLPDGIRGRFREKWLPLKRVAVQAGASWPETVDSLAVQDKEEYLMDKMDGLHKEAPQAALLKNIYGIWPGDSVGFLPTTELISRLVAAHPAVWGVDGPFNKELTAQRLGKMLAQGYKIHSRREHRTGPRGYAHADFLRPWRRMQVIPPDVTGASGAAGATGAEEGS